MEGLIFFLIFTIIICSFIIPILIGVYSGNYYKDDEEILKKRPFSAEARRIEADRQSGRYLEYTYIPKEDREDYLRRYPTDPNDKKKDKR